MTAMIHNDGMGTTRSLAKNLTVLAWLEALLR